MKKFGFTLAEILLSMTIIGIVAALTAPTLINMMPNREKAMTLKYRKLITEINVELLNNRSYYVNGEFDTVDPIDTDLIYLLNDKEKSYRRKNKYAYLLMRNLESYNEEGWGYDDENNPPKIDKNKAEFYTKDGFQWFIKVDGSGAPTSIKIDMNGAGEPNSYGGTGVTNPDQFYFKIEKDTGFAECDEKIDPITCRYLKCPYYMNNKKHDYECMKNYSGDCACEQG